MSIALVATMILGCVAMLSGCQNASTNDDDDKTSDSGNKDKDKDKDKDKVDKEQYENLSDEEYMQKLEQNNIGGILDTITDFYGSLDSMDPSNSSLNMGAEMNISVQVGDMIIDMLEDRYSSSTGDYMDFSFLSKLGLDIDMDFDGSMMAYDMALALSNHKLVSMQMIMDMTEAIVWMGIPELNDTFLKVETEGVDVDMGSVMDMLTQLSTIEVVRPSAEQLSEILNRYIGIALSNIKNVQRTDTTLELDGLKQDCTLMTVKIYEADALAVVKAVITEALEDEELEEIIDNFSEFYNEAMRISYEEMDYSWEWNDVDLHEQFVAMLENALEGMDVPEDELDTESYIELLSYIDDDHNVIGRAFSMPENDRPMVHYYTVTEGNAFAFEAVLEPASVSLVGSGTNKGGVIDAEYTLNVSGTDMVVFELEDWENNGAEDVSGTVRIEPTAQLIQNITGGSNSLPFADVALEIKLDLGKNFYMELNLLGNDELVVGLILDSKSTSADSVQVPSNSIDINDSYALQEWVEEMDFDTILRNLRNAGVPSELVDMLEQTLNSSMNGGYTEPDYDYGYEWDDEF